MNHESERLMEIYLIEVVANGRLDLIEDLFHGDVIDEAALAFGGRRGIEGLRAHVVGFRRNVGSLAITIDRVVAAADEVMAQWSFSGTHDGPWLNRAPTGAPISGTVFSFFDLRDGRVSRYHLWLHAQFDESVVFDSSKGES